MAKKTNNRIVCTNIATVLVLMLIFWFIFQWVSKRQEYPCNLKMFPAITAPAASILCAAFGCTLVAGIAGGLSSDVRCQLISYLAPVVFVVLLLLGSAAGFHGRRAGTAGWTTTPAGFAGGLEMRRGGMRSQVVALGLQPEIPHSSRFLLCPSSFYPPSEGMLYATKGMWVPICEPNILV